MYVLLIILHTGERGESQTMNDVSLNSRGHVCVHQLIVCTKLGFVYYMLFVGHDHYTYLHCTCTVYANMFARVFLGPGLHVHGDDLN